MSMIFLCNKNKTTLFLTDLRWTVLEIKGPFGVWHKESKYKAPMASLELVSPGAATDGCLF